MGKMEKRVDLRSEFNRMRRRLLKENNIEHLICARCGEWRHSTHLHHMKALVEGGTNDVENLIPLCGSCHREWDEWDNGQVDFGVFLITPKIQDIRKVFFGRIAISAQSLRLTRAMRECVYSQQWDEVCHEGEDEYRVEYKRQNEIFNTYPYSDAQKMLEVYGDVGTPVVLEDFDLLRSGEDLAEMLKLRVACRQPI